MKICFIFFIKKKEKSKPGPPHCNTPPSYFYFLFWDRVLSHSITRFGFELVPPASASQSSGVTGVCLRVQLVVSLWRAVWCLCASGADDVRMPSEAAQMLTGVCSMRWPSFRRSPCLWVYHWIFKRCLCPGEAVVPIWKPFDFSWWFCLKCWPSRFNM